MKCAIRIVVSSVIVLLATSAAGAYTGPRIDRILADGWRFVREDRAGAAAKGYDDSSWEKVTLPHTWNGADGQDGGNDYYRGIGWYRRSLDIKREFKGKRIFLRFEAATTAAEVFVNGSLAGTHKGGFAAFCFEITSFVTPGSHNILSVKVSNAKDTTISPLRGDFTVCGGLYRPVHLLVLEPLSITPLDDASSGVYVTQTFVSDSVAEIDVKTKLENGGVSPASPTIRVTVLDGKGKIVRSESHQANVAAKSGDDVLTHLSVRRPHLWNGVADPYLYTVRVDVLDKGVLRDRVEQNVGLRTFSVNPERGFFLNGKSYPLHGVNRHQDRKDIGWAVSQKDFEEDNAIIRELGANVVRLAHYQHAQNFYDLCDRGGTIVWSELALVDYINAHPDFRTICQQQLREMIKQNYNHPSIVFWSLENELIPEADPQWYETFVRDLNALAKSLDPGRLTTVASRSKFDFGWGVNNVTDVIGFNVYRGWYLERPEDFGPFVDSLHRMAPQRPMGVSEYGAGAGIHQHEYPPVKPADARGPWHPEEWQAVVHETVWKAMTERPYLWGTFVWCMFDFASDGRKEGEDLGRNDKGLVSFDRKTRKDAFYWYKANWNPEPMVYITGRRYSPRPAGAPELKVYSNCDSVELFLNGKSLGTVQSVDRIYRWPNVQLHEGKNTLRAVARKGKKKVSDQCSISVVAPDR